MNTRDQPPGLHSIKVAILFIVAVTLAHCNTFKNKNNYDMNNHSVRVRYIVNDVNASVAFYRDVLNFNVDNHPGEAFAQLSYAPLTLLLNRPGNGGAGQAMPGGEMPAPGGWNRIQLTVENLEEMIDTLKRKGAKFRNELVKGNGGRQILLMDPSGNLIELFEPY